MATVDLDNTLEIMAESTKDKKGTVVKSKLKKNIDVCLPWTQSTFGDGVPINKNFGRCQTEIRLLLKEGEELNGVKHLGYATGCQMFCFYYNDIWFEAKDMDAEYILESLGEELQTE